MQSGPTADTTKGSVCGAAAMLRPRDRRNGKLLNSVRLAYEATKEFRKNLNGAKDSKENKEDIDILANLSEFRALLYELFAGIPPFKDGSMDSTSVAGLPPPTMLELASDALPTAQEKRMKRRIPWETHCAPLMEFGMPASICDLFSHLMDTKDSSECFKRIEDVEADLCCMINNPERFFFDQYGELHCDKLKFSSDKLYGRDDHMSKLMEACQSAMDKTREAIFVSGYSGTGKSALVQRAKGLLSQQDVCFVSGKFDEMGQVEPLSVVVSAFNKYCNVMLEIYSSEKIDEVRASIKDTVGNDVKVLTDLIPNLSKVIGEAPSAITAKVRGKEAKNRLKFLFRMFVRAVSSPCHPVILFLDDLQWAEEESLELIRFLITDAENRSLLFLGCYRDNEVGLDHPLTVLLKEIEEAGVNITDIKVDNLDKNTVNELISDTLHLLPRVTQPLASILHSKTSGNVLFLIQFLLLLHEDGLVYFSLGLRRWKWDIDTIRSKKIATNVALLMMDKISKLEQDVQSALKVAACFGLQCEESVLKLLEDDSCDFCKGITSNLDVAVEEGIMVKIGSSFRFSHDQIQLAAYSSTPGSEKNALHLCIGRLIWKRVSEAELEDMIFVVAGQLNRGSNLITDCSEKIEAARLNLRAGVRAITSSSFLFASIYLMKGISFLGENSWENNYELSLQLFTFCVETQYITGNFSRIDDMLMSIFSHGRCISDKLRAYCTLISTLGAQNKAPASIATGLDVLALLGESFPIEIDQHVIRRELLTTKNLLEGTTTERILQNDPMQDSVKLAAIQFLDLIIFYTFVGRQELFPLVAFRMVRLTLSYGACKESAFGFAAFGMVLCCYFHDVVGGYRFGKLALSLLERFKAKECLARVHGMVYSFINIWVEPLQAGLASFSYSYQVGLSTGDMQMTMANANVYIYRAFQCGRRLEQLAEEMRLYIDQMSDFKQKLSLYAALPYYQALYNLMGSSEDPTKLTGKFMDQEEVLGSALEMKNWNAVLHVYLLRMKLSYMFEKYDLAAEMAGKIQQVIVSSGNRYRGAAIVDETFYTGLLAATLARTKQQRKWQRFAESSVKKLSNWTRLSSWNFQHKLELLTAECAFLDRDIQTAAKFYDRSIQSAGRHGFIHEQALACERAAIFSLEIGNKITATEYYSLSHELYIKWGARRKADDILPKLK